MGTLSDIRKKNERKDLLLTGMEQNPVKLPSDVYSNEKELYENKIKPHVRSFFARQVAKGNI